MLEQCLVSKVTLALLTTRLVLLFLLLLKLVLPTLTVMELLDLFAIVHHTLKTVIVLMLFWILVLLKRLIFKVV